MMPECLDVLALTGKIVQVHIVVMEERNLMLRARNAIWIPTEPKEILVGLVREQIQGPRDWSPRVRKKNYEGICPVPAGSMVVIYSMNDEKMTQEARIDPVRGDSEVGIFDRNRLSG